MFAPECKSNIRDGFSSQFLIAIENDSLKLETGIDPDKPDCVYCTVVDIDSGEPCAGLWEIDGSVSVEVVEYTLKERLGWDGEKFNI